MKDNSSFELKTSLNHMSESKCRRGLNLDPIVQVTDKPCRLMKTKALVQYFPWHLSDAKVKLSVGQSTNF